MASAENGDNVVLKIIGASATVLAVASEIDFTINRSADAIDTTAKGDAAATNMAPSFHSKTLDFSALYVRTDAAHVQLLALMDANTQVSFEIFVAGSSDQTGTGVITSLNMTYTNNSAATFEGSIAIDGALA
jgi:predicted secreted protein